MRKVNGASYTLTVTAQYLREDPPAVWLNMWRRLSGFVNKTSEVNLTRVRHGWHLWYRGQWICMLRLPWERSLKLWQGFQGSGATF